MDFFPAYRREDSGEIFSDEETIAELTRAGPEGIYAIMRKRSEVHKIYLSKINIGFVFDVIFSPRQRNLRCVKLLINKADLLTNLVKAGHLPGVTNRSYAKLEKVLFGQVIQNIKTTCRQNGIRNFSVMRTNSTDPGTCHAALSSVLAECSGRGKYDGT